MYVPRRGPVMISSAFVEAATYMYAPGLSEFVCVPFFFFCRCLARPAPTCCWLRGVSFRISFRWARLWRVISFRFKFRFVWVPVTSLNEKKVSAGSLNEIPTLDHPFRNSPEFFHALLKTTDINITWVKARLTWCVCVVCSRCQVWANSLDQGKS